MKGFVYAIKSHNTDLVYVGSTHKTIKRRLTQHRCDFKRFNAGKYRNVSVFQIIELGDYYIEVLESFEDIEKIPLKKRENHFIDISNSVNIKKAYNPRKIPRICPNIRNYSFSETF